MDGDRALIGPGPRLAGASAGSSKANSKSGGSAGPPGSPAAEIGTFALRDRGVRGEDDVPASRPHPPRPPALTLLLCLEAIPGPRLHEIATCLGLWDTQGLNKPDLIRLMQRAPMINADAVWLQMSVLEQGSARTSLAQSDAVRDFKPPKPSTISLFEVLDPRVLTGRLGQSTVSGLLGTVRGTTRRLLSLLLLLPGARAASIAAALEVQGKNPLEIATDIERKKVPSRRVLAALSDRELRTAAAVWAVTASREEIINQLAATIDTGEGPEDGIPRAHPA